MEMSQWGTLKVRIAVSHGEFKDRQVVVYRKFCERSEAIGLAQDFFNQNPDLPKRRVSVLFTPTSDVIYIK